MQDEFTNMFYTLAIILLLITLIFIPTLDNETETKNVKSMDMRITGYIPTGNKTALMQNPIVGWTAAVSPACAPYFLGSNVYIPGYGVRNVSDLTHPRLDKEFGICTMDILVPTKEDAMKIGNRTNTVIRIN